MSRQAFWNVDIESLDQDHVETNRDAQAYLCTRHFGGNFQKNEDELWDIKASQSGNLISILKTVT
jgi:hypothetical protein